MASTVTSDSLDRTGKLVAIGVFVALVVDGMDLQMLALALPTPLEGPADRRQSLAGALGTYTLLGMGIGGITAGWLSDRIGRRARRLVGRLHVHDLHRSSSPSATRTGRSR